MEEIVKLEIPQLVKKGIIPSDATAKPEDVISGKTFYSGDVEIKTGTLDLTILDELKKKSFTGIGWKEGTNNILEYKNIDNETVKELELSPFVQEQSDLSETDNQSETFIKNKSTRYLLNEGEDGTSKYATEKYVKDNGGKIDSISVNGKNIDIDELKNVNITIPENISDFINDTNFITKDVDNLEHYYDKDYTDKLVENLDENYNHLNTTLTDLEDEVESNKGDINGNRSLIQQIQNLIPSQADALNTLADRNFVNSTVQTNTANFRGSYSTWNDVPLNTEEYPEDYGGNKKPTQNDYIVVLDASGYPDKSLTGTWRFKFTGNWDIQSVMGWKPEYQVNREPLTSNQIAALNSNITSEKVEEITENTSKRHSHDNKDVLDKINYEDTLTNIKSNASVAQIGSSNNVARSDHIHPFSSAETFAEQERIKSEDNENYGEIIHKKQLDDAIKTYITSTLGGDY